MTWLILASLMVGKMVGICLMSIIAANIGFPRPEGVGLRELFVVSLVASIGLTVALFVTGEAFQAVSPAVHIDTSIPTSVRASIYCIHRQS